MRMKAKVARGVPRTFSKGSQTAFLTDPTLAANTSPGTSYILLARQFLSAPHPVRQQYAESVRRHTPGPMGNLAKLRHRLKMTNKFVDGDDVGNFFFPNKKLSRPRPPPSFPKHTKRQ
jgi:hypothetical protein